MLWKKWLIIFFQLNLVYVFVELKYLIYNKNIKEDYLILLNLFFDNFGQATELQFTMTDETIIIS